LRQGSGRRVTEVEKGKPERKERGTGIGEKRRGKGDQEREGERYMGRKHGKRRRGKRGGRGLYIGPKTLFFPLPSKSIFFLPPRKNTPKFTLGFIFALLHLFFPINQ
jgi:hypothetical protein